VCVCVCFFHTYLGSWFETARSVVAVQKKHGCLECEQDKESSHESAGFSKISSVWTLANERDDFSFWKTQIEGIEVSYYQS
jgi:hypothetical protein